MLTLLSNYSVQEILVFICTLALAVKGFWSYIEWIKTKYKEKFDKDYQDLIKEGTQEDRYQHNIKEHQELVDGYSKLENEIRNLNETLNGRLSNIEKDINQLRNSDMHDIKGWIVEKHHHFIKRGWVDDFSMDTLEKRYEDYVDEGGNSYIAGLMAELRKLSHANPNESE